MAFLVKDNAFLGKGSKQSILVSECEERENSAVNVHLLPVHDTGIHPRYVY